MGGGSRESKAKAKGGKAKKRSAAQPARPGAHGYEKDVEGEAEYLWWPKLELSNTTQLWTPVGEECGKCACVRGTNALQASESVNVKAETTKQLESYNDAFEEGHFHDLVQFACDRNLRFPDQESLIKHIEEQMQYEVGFGGAGVLGAFVTEMPRGAQCKFSRGMKRSALRREVEGHADADGAKDRHAENVEVDGLAAGGDSAEQHLQDRQDFDAEEPSPSPPVGFMAGFTTSAAGAASTVGSEDIASVAQPPPKKKGRRSSAAGSPAANTVESGRALLEGAETAFQLSAIWNKTFRPRDFENMLTILSAKASKVAAVPGEPGEPQHIQELKDAPMKAVDNPSDILAILTKADVTTQANMLSTTSFNLMSLGIDGMVAALKVAKDLGGASFSVGALTGAGDLDELKATAQTNMISSSVGKSLKRMSEADYSNMMLQCDTLIGPVDVGSLDVQVPAVSESTGRLPQVLFGLDAMRLFGKIRGLDSSEASAGSSAKAAWDCIAKQDVGSEIGPLAFSVEESLKQFTSEIGGALTRMDNGAAVEQLCTSLVKAAEGEGNDIDLFSKYVDTLDDDEDKIGQKNVELLKLRDEFISTTCAAMSAVLSHYGNFSAYANVIMANNLSYSSPGESGILDKYEADPFQLVVQVATFLLCFDLGASDRAVIVEAQQRSQIMVDVADVQSRSNYKDSASVATMWSEIWIKEGALKCASKVKDTNAACFQSLSEELSSYSVQAPIDVIFTNIVGSPECRKVELKFLAAMKTLESRLPPSVASLVDSAKSYMPIRQCCEQISQGKSVGCIAANTHLRLHDGLHDVVKGKAEMKTWKDALIKEWQAGAAMIVSNLDATHVDAFLAKYGPDGENLWGLIVTWTFDEKRWLASSTPDALREAEFQKAESFVVNFTMSERIVEDLCATTLPASWASPGELEQLRDTKNKLPSLKDKRNQVAKLMGAAVLCNAIVTDVSKQSTLKYVTVANALA
ncbi:unnamed protein product [Prorocentrum cordatum]|uniref:Uncharacterized protein n=1 Tax=Prorocentrum cordatum TaxID=2364126 RepID=A0ABN9PAN7_9DINO|nr:unnamed protein product [Polarella glacialis]